MTVNLFILYMLLSHSSSHLQQSFRNLNSGPETHKCIMCLSYVHIGKCMDNAGMKGVLAVVDQDVISVKVTAQRTMVIPPN